MLTAQVISLEQSEEGRPITTESELAVLGEMRQRLQAAVKGGWSDYPVLPAAVNEPVKTAVYRMHFGKQETYPIVAWPQEEYRRWRLAWNWLAGEVLQRLGAAKAFPLGDGEKFGAWYETISKPDSGWESTPLQIVAFENVKKVPTVLDALAASASLIAEVNRKLSSPKKKPLITSTMIIGALAVIAVSGGLYYYYRHEGGFSKKAKRLPPVPQAKPLPEPYPMPEPEPYAMPLPSPSIPGRLPQ